MAGGPIITEPARLTITPIALGRDSASGALLGMLLGACAFFGRFCARTRPEAVGPRVGFAFNNISDERTENGSELEGVTAVSGCNDEAGVCGIVVDPERAIKGVAVEAESGGNDGCGGEGRECLTQEVAESLLGTIGNGARLEGIDANADTVVGNLDDALLGGGKSIPAGASDVRRPDREIWCAESGGILRAEMENGLACGPHDVFKMREESWRPSTSGHEDDVSAPSAAIHGDNAVIDQAGEGSMLVDIDAKMAGMIREHGDGASAFDPAAEGVEIAITIAVGIPKGMELPEVSALAPVQSLASGGEEMEAVMLETAGPHGLGGENEETVLVIQGGAESVVPAFPASDGGLAHFGINEVGGVVRADHFADVGGGGIRVRDAALIQQSDTPAALSKLDGRGDAEFTGTDDKGMGHGLGGCGV